MDADVNSALVQILLFLGGGTFIQLGGLLGRGLGPGLGPGLDNILTRRGMA